jgi:cysteine synthase
MLIIFIGAVKLARKLGPGHVITTVLSDGGQRYLSKLYNKIWLEKNNLQPIIYDNLDFVE